MNLTEIRNTNFCRNELLEKLLIDLNSDLQPAEKLLSSQYAKPKMHYPVVFVMGPLRSGTTLFTQWLANTGLFAYPTNLLSRFFQAPIIGAKIQLLLTDQRYNFRDELGEFIQQSEYISENGKTKGVLAPNEFWYFWRRFLSERNRDVWTDDELRQTMDTQTMFAELAGIMDVFQKPFAAKGMLFNYNIPFLNSIFDKVIFVQIKRDPVTNVDSVLEARKRQLGSEEAWYSFEIPESESLKELDPISQCAGQVFYINKAVRKGMAKVDESRKMIVQYENFCQAPEEIFQELITKLGMKGFPYSGLDHFEKTRQGRLENRSLIEQALAKFKNLYD